MLMTQLRSLLCFFTLLGQVGKTLSERRWKAAFSKDGYLDIAGVLRRIQRGVHLFLPLFLYCIPHSHFPLHACNFESNVLLYWFLYLNNYEQLWKMRIGSFK